MTERDDPLQPAEPHPEDEELHRELQNLPRELAPPASLEQRVTTELQHRGLLGAKREAATPQTGLVRWALPLAASLLALGTGFWLGRLGHQAGPDRSATAASAATYALLLYETPGYERATGAAERDRFDEYSRWVAEARRRGQFVGGEDLAVDRGWRVAPAPQGLEIRPGVALEVGGAPLSGIFFITADEDSHALSLAESLPHLRHGGEVVLQRILPTDSPPETVERAGSDSSSD